MNRFILSTVLLSFSTTALADLKTSRTEFCSWTLASEPTNHAVDPMPHDYKSAFDSPAKATSVKQLYIPQSLEDARKQLDDIDLHTYKI